MTQEFKGHYDWVVFGDHPGALISANMAANFGLKVLQVPLAESLGVTVSEAGQILDPERNQVIGLGKLDGENSLLSLVLSHLEVLPAFLKEVKRSETELPQILTPSSRVKMRFENQHFLTELRSKIAEVEEADDRSSDFIGSLDFLEKNLVSFWRQLPVELFNKYYRERSSRFFDVQKGLDGFLRRRIQKNQREISRFLALGNSKVKDQWFVSEKSRDLWRGFWFASMDSNSLSWANSDIVRAIAFGKEIVRFRGGLKAYRKFLKTLAVSNGVDFLENDRLEKIVYEDGRIRKLRLRNSDQVIHVVASVAGCAVEHIKDKIEFVGKKNRARFRTLPPVGWKFSLAFTVSKNALPPGVNSKMIWKERMAPSLEVEIAKNEDYLLENEESVLVFVRSHLPFTQETLDPVYLRKMAYRMYRQLRELLPFFEKHVENAFPDVREEAALKEDLGTVYGFKTLSEIPENLRTYELSGLGIRSGVPGLYVISGESYPCYGDFGGVVAMIDAIQHFFSVSGLIGDDQIRSFWKIPPERPKKSFFSLS